eukprot:Hpha_TRINITY_DN15412_c0_g4::TRINITY_DN15412_c0_g4_i1::g.175275::m.175275
MHKVTRSGLILDDREGVVGGAVVRQLRSRGANLTCVLAGSGQVGALVLAAHTISTLTITTPTIGDDISAPLVFLGLPDALRVAPSGLHPPHARRRGGVRRWLLPLLDFGLSVGSHGLLRVRGHLDALHGLNTDTVGGVDHYIARGVLGLLRGDHALDTNHLALRDGTTILQLQLSRRDDLTTHGHIPVNPHCHSNLQLQRRLVRLALRLQLLLLLLPRLPTRLALLPDLLALLLLLLLLHLTHSLQLCEFGLLLLTLRFALRQLLLRLRQGLLRTGYVGLLGLKARQPACLPLCILLRLSGGRFQTVVLAPHPGRLLVSPVTAVADPVIYPRGVNGLTCVTLVLAPEPHVSEPRARTGPRLVTTVRAVTIVVVHLRGPPIGTHESLRSCVLLTKMGADAQRQFGQVDLRGTRSTADHGDQGKNPNHSPHFPSFLGTPCPEPLIDRPIKYRN